MKQFIPKELPLAKRIVDKFGNPNLFERANVIFALHQTGDFVPLVLELLRMGLKKKRSWFLDIPYSSNEKVKLKLLSLGFSETNFSPAFSFGPLSPYEYHQNLRARKFMESSIKAGIESKAGFTIIFDDGGHSALSSSEIELILKENKHPVLIIEQTTNGINWIRRQKLPELCPVLNIAHSKIKELYEAPVIAGTIWKNIENKLLSSHIKTEDKKILILGYGRMGKSIADHLLEILRIPKEQITIKPGPEFVFYNLKDQELKRITIENLLGQHFLVVGCTGAKSFYHSLIPLLDSKAFLVNASSWNLEFPKEEWVSAALNNGDDSCEILNPDELKDRKDLHCNIEFRIQDKDIILANAGYPVNFSGHLNSSEPEKMQLTIGLLLMGAIQMTERKHEKGEYSIPESKENHIVEMLKDLDTSKRYVTYFKT